MKIHPVDVIGTMINFLILFLFLRYKFFGKVNNILTARSEGINNDINSAKANNKKSELLRLENEEKLKAASTEGKSIVENFKAKAETISKQIVDEANSEAQNTLEKGKKDLQREVDKATADIKSQVVDLAVMLSAKALGQTIDEEQHRKLIAEFISKVGI
ncbi:MAG: F0F1 ATP synthase subunit B [Clostridiaceae bacterium]|nr:F0F1 ATP synthase subunit B [Clostridiaceae bacterium]